MKKTIIFLIFLSFLINLSVCSIYANEEGINWYAERSGNKQPVISGEHLIIEKYNGYYVDKSCNDSSEVKKIYITFDAGYENGNIAKILDILKEKNVPAAFFILSHLICKNTDIVLRMADEGHLVCNHTTKHKDQSSLTDAEIEDNILRLEKLYIEKTGKIMSKYFRFPEGRYSERSIAKVCSMGYKSVFWSFGYDDWDNERQPSPERAVEKILSNTHNGEIILLHPTSATNVIILPELIDRWRQMGYSFGTLDELI